LNRLALSISLHKTTHHVLIKGGTGEKYGFLGTEIAFDLFGDFLNFYARTSLKIHNPLLDITLKVLLLPKSDMLT